MRKVNLIITATLSIFLLLSLTACSDDNTTTEIQTETTSVVESESAEKILHYDFTVNETSYQHEDGRKIVGYFYMPDFEADKYPTAILSHGLGGSYEDCVVYAEYLASKGYACYVFDFCGGSTSSLSDGKMTDMSVLTEKDDLNVVLDSVKKENFVDTDNIFLLGGSQGGLVSALVASDRVEEIAGLILLFPAFVIPDYVNQVYNSIDNIPDDPSTLGIPVGKKYVEDAMNLDVYEEIKNYDKDVLIIHGTKDIVVPISYSKKAVEVYNSARLVEIEDAGHGFHDQKSVFITELEALNYLKEVMD